MLGTLISSGDIGLRGTREECKKEEPFFFPEKITQKIEESFSCVRPDFFVRKRVSE